MAIVPPPREAITLLLGRWKHGDEAALEELLPLVRADLLRRARRYLAHEPGAQSINSSDLIQEAWLQLLKQKNISYTSRSDFYALASTIMRHILVDHARSKRAQRRGGGLTRVTLSRVDLAQGNSFEDVLALHEAMEILVSEDERKAAILDMYYFGGLTIEEIAAATNLAIATVHKHKTMAEARVRRELSRQVS